MATTKDRTQLQSLTEAKNKDDDWSGMDSAARRKRQNRLNQRAYRRRKAQQEQEQAAQHQPAIIAWEYQVLPSPQTSDSQTTYSSETALIPAALRPPRPPPKAPLIPYITPDSPSLIPGPITFPLTPDHLITLIQYNVLRATLTNMSIMSLLHTLPAECSNALSIPIPPAPTSIPPSLAPTALQKAHPHDSWIDTLPHPRMRDNLILLRGTYDRDDLCSDMVGGLFEGYNDCERRGWVVWGEPWCVDGWEFSEGFARKWGSLLLRGCGELVASTNRWRGLRGERALVVEV